jgi:hypothetical protein
MAGPAPQQARQPYGTPNQPIPQYAPPGRQKGSLAPKVWGIILLILGLLGVINFISSIASLGGGISGSSFAPGVSPEVKQEMDRMALELVTAMKGRWTFWLNMASEGVLMVLTVAAGVFLVVKPKPLGRKLAIARALLVLLMIPVAGYEGIETVNQQMEMQQRIMKISAQDAVKEREKTNPSKDDAEREQRRKDAEQMMDSAQPIMKAFGVGAVVATIVIVIIINGLLLLFITRPAVKEYLESVAKTGDNSIPGYDPSMGLMQGPPPGPPHPGQPSPGDQPPEPPQQQIPPV